jgi:hypothetical protein
LSPVGCGQRPDCHRRLSKVRIVESADAHKNQMRPRLGLAEERRPARRTESPVHLVATVRDASIVVRLSGHCEGGSAEASVDRSAARTDILALPAPAHARDNRRLRAFPADCPAEASSCDRHSVFQAKEAILESYVGGHKFGKHVGSTGRPAPMGTATPNPAVNTDAHRRGFARAVVAGYLTR